MDEDILDWAVENEGNLFLEYLLNNFREVWESFRKFGNFRNFYAPKISFSKYIEIMLKHEKLEMASEAIKNWCDAYKEENVFDTLMQNGEEDLLM
jgi:hypothetical protein